jgi:hypothetical protein
MTERILSEDQVAAIAAAAEAIIPADTGDPGVAPLGPGHVIGMRARYQPHVAEFYASGLEALEESVRIMFGPDRRFAELSLSDRARVLTALRRGSAPGAAWRDVSCRSFYAMLRADVCFVYLTDPDVSRRIGFPGESTSRGGYPDYDQPQA